MVTCPFLRSITGSLLRSSRSSRMSYKNKSTVVFCGVNGSAGRSNTISADFSGSGPPRVKIVRNVWLRSSIMFVVVLTHEVMEEATL